MKPYADVFKKPFTQTDVEQAVAVICQTKRRPSSSLLQRRLGWGYGKILNMYELLEDAKVVGPVTRDASRTLYLKNQASAVNAALRQLKKGKR